MKTTNLIPRNLSFYGIIGLISSLLVSCGSYQNTSYYDADGIYSSNKTPQTNQNNATTSSQGDYYSNYFKRLDDNFTYFTDINGYNSQNSGDSLSYTTNAVGYGGWGDDTQGVTVNLYNDNFYNPYYGGGFYNSFYPSYWGSGWNIGFGWNSGWGWGANIGWGGGFGWGGYPYYGWGGYPYYGSYYRPYYNHYRYRNASYTNGYRSSRNNTINNSGRDSYQRGRYIQDGSSRATINNSGRRDFNSNSSRVQSGSSSRNNFNNSSLRNSSSRTYNSSSNRVNSQRSSNSSSRSDYNSSSSRSNYNSTNSSSRSSSNYSSPSRSSSSGSGRVNSSGRR